MPETNDLQQASLSAGVAKDALDELQKEFAHAQRVGKTAGLIAFGSLLQGARVYLAALERWSEEMAE
jgi:hypothetical protein